MPIDSRHPSYNRRAEDWRKCRDTIDGEHAVRARKEVYLPPPPGFQKNVVSSHLQAVNGRTGPANRYEFYALFAEFPEIVAPALNGIQGLIHSQQLGIVLPGRMQYLLESATGAGETIFDLWEKITREILTTGRITLLAEVAASSDDIYLCPYVAESLINWRLLPKINGGMPSLIVLEEHSHVPNADDPYELKEMTTWRELLLMDGRYVVRLWSRLEGKEPQIIQSADGEELTIPVLFGSAFSEIPITVINAVDYDFEPGSIPLLPAARRALAIFRKSADYHRALYVKGDPQPVITGVDKSEAPTEIGGSSVWTFSDTGAKAYFLDIDGNGIPLMREAIQDEYERFSAEIGRLLDVNDKAGAESGEALRRRHSMQLITVKSVVLNAAAGLQRALRQIARLMRLSESEIAGIEVNPSLDFAEGGMSADELLKLVMAANQGAPISRESIHELMRRGNLTEMTFDDELEAIQDQGPALGMIGAGASTEADAGAA